MQVLHVIVTHRAPNQIHVVTLQVLQRLLVSRVKVHTRQVRDQLQIHRRQVRIVQRLRVRPALIIQVVVQAVAHLHHHLLREVQVEVVRAVVDNCFVN